MILPLLDTVGCGVVVDGSAIRIVEIALRRGRARVVRVGEAVGEGAAFRDVPRPARPFASLALDLPPLPGATCLRPPDLEHADDLAAWTVSQVGPAAAPPGDGRSDDGAAEWVWQAVRTSEDAPVLVAPVLRADAAAAALSEGGLSVGRVGHSGLEAWASLALSDTPLGGPILYAADGYGAWVDVVNGQVEQAGTETLARALEAVTRLAGGRAVTIIGPDAEAVAEEVTLVYGVPAQVGVPLAGVKGGDLPPRFAAAAGLAVADLYAAIPSFDVLPAQTALAARRRVERWAAARVLLVGASLVLVLLGALRAARFAADADADRSAADQAGQDAAVAQLGRAEREVAALRTRGRGASAARTGAALAYSRVANALPDGVWLASIEWTTESLSLEALSADALGVEATLAAADGVLDGVRLGGVQRVEGPPPLYRFSLSAAAPPPPR